MNVAALNHAVRNIPAEQLRMHLCWGNYPGPHHCDVPIGDIIDIVWQAKPQTVLFEAANPRHAHEWAPVRDRSACPTARCCAPASSSRSRTTSSIPSSSPSASSATPTWSAATAVMAGVDCGFSVHVGMQGIDPDVAWAKLGLPTPPSPWCRA
jgi:5-methyltetrahydropteroyltriglutamate--homocysteine methyltransferase